ncbi:dihydrolipoamide acetyltransferase component of pyruvate dehydrogenase complex [Fulvitalea axinellae]|uniref:Dihydrolipoamide acetyltransferase component of pyruvate dehydrogenase complex n=1 Tax=Fulvitalea axinellae TaxID=1182444 RepID=A0AAU9DDK8_9BACT|nr:dihydrolipoamide acetyltransferase component of pyruvate dehydrogenase complex [Fulvitalea axinellae]
MAIIEMLMPSLGESVFEATVLGWLKNEGDPISEDESALEVATDKVDTEVPSVHEGVIHKILVKEGEVAKVGQALALIEIEGEGEEPTEAPATAETETETAPQAPQTETQSPSAPTATGETASGDNRFYSPLVRTIAKTENISSEELANIPGSGRDNRVTKADILAYLENRTAGATTQEVAKPATNVSNGQTPQPTFTPAPVSVSGDDEIIEMDRMRKMIAERMVASKHTAPHVTSFVEADVTGIVNWRNKVKNTFAQKHGEKITFMPIFIEAIAKALNDFPMMNVSVDGDNIIRRKDINIGIAVALPSGNLIVPVIRNADRLNLTGLTKAINDLAVRARENKLRPDELSGGTYTVSNIGSFGNISGTPIIMQPQVGILALGAIVKKPAVIETPDGDMIGIRQKMILSHSYDHRVVDGALGGMFVKRVGEYLEAFDTQLSV